MTTTMSRKLIHPFNEKVRERIFGFTSSGTDHEEQSDLSSSSSTCSAASQNLSFLVQSFLEADQTNESAEAIESEDDEHSDPAALIREVVNPIVRSKDRFRADLVAQVTQAAEMFSIFKSNPAVLNRNVMTYLREIGYNSGICKTKWEAIPCGGSHEFLDVIHSDLSSRYIVDLSFGAQFEVARESVRYRSVIGGLPRIFVGKCEDLRRIVRVMAEELRRTMKVSGMSLPPWRKNKYLLAKWFGPYRRTVSQIPSSGAVSSGFSVVQCRSVGFFSADLDAPVTGRTRYIA